MDTTGIRAWLLLASVPWVSAAYAQSTVSQGPAGNSNASTASAAGSPDLSEVIVTAQKRNERLQDVPLSITAVTGDQLARQGISGPADLEKIAPGFTYRQSQNGTPVFAIRGIGFYSEQAAVAPTVTIYTDQVPLPYARMAEGAALDIERVEVLKGPQGTLFGQNSTAGAVNYIAVKPTEQPAAGLEATYGRFNELDAAGFVSGPIAQGLSARFAVRSEHRDDWQNGIIRNDALGQRNFLVGRLLVDWQPADPLSIGLNVNGWRDRSDTQASQARGYLPVSPLPPLTPQTAATAAALTSYPYVTSNDNRLADWGPGKSYHRDDNFYQFAARINYDFSDHFRLISLSSYANLKLFSPIDADGTFVPALVINQHGKIKTFSQELRLEGERDQLKWVVGGNYQRDDTDEVQFTIIKGSNSQLPNRTLTAAVSFDGIDLYNNQQVHSQAGFLNLDRQLTDTISIQGGVRYTAENRDFSGCIADNGTPSGFGTVLGIPRTPDGCVTFLPSGAPGRYQAPLDENNVSWRGSVNWKPAADTLLYANVTKGYKSGDFGTLPAVSYQQFQPVRQESVVACEAGFKTTLIDRKVDLSAAVFYDDYRSKQTQGSIVVPPFGNLPYLVNVPKSRLVGAEFDLMLRPVQGLRVSVGGNYLSSKIIGTAPVASPFGAPVDANGEELPVTPKWQLQGDAEYDFRVMNNVSAFLGGNLSWRASSVAALGSKTGPAGTQDWFDIDGYALLDLRAGIEIEDKYRLQVFGKNVTNKGYWNNVVHIYDTYDRITGSPATYGVTVSARF